MSGLAPELQILILNAAALGVAYLGIYPSMPRLTLRRMMWSDLAITALVMTVAGLLFFGSGERFSLILFSVSWWSFTLLTAFAMEWPLFLRFCRARGIDPFDPEAWDEDQD